ncbi:endonuclease [Pseudoalteromonas phage H101]|uniref:CapR homology domain-containing protein n=1 Tax=Pseudoalteromonas phage H101 TaxID=1654919 RepID=A0A0H4IT98_9CAUD|nr:endonuclease [Pseudoalteromonas phage H101]AKO61121.1 hypothetical protein [Pseudoalteromonas phage H101]
MLDNKDSFTGTEIATPKEGILTVKYYQIIPKNKRNNKNTKRYICECSICSLDKELWPLGSINAPKYNLTHGNIPCGCAVNPKWKEFQWEVKVKRETEKRGYIFSGWVNGEFKGDKTKLLMHNPETGNTWNTLSAGKFIAGQGDPKTKHHLKQRKSDQHYRELFESSGKFPEGTIFERDNINKDKFDCYSYFNVTCPLCKDDIFSKAGFPYTFRGASSSLRTGARPCRCYTGYSKNIEEQTFYLDYLCKDEGHTSLGITDEYKGAKFTKFNWLCKEGHENITNINDFTTNGVRCRSCYDNIPRTQNGYYKDRVDEDDMLYVLLFHRPEDSFIKVGRSFVVTRRARELDLKGKFGANSVDCLFIIQGRHDDIWHLEQETLEVFRGKFRFFCIGEHKGGSECLSCDCTEQVIDYIEERVNKDNTFFITQERK